MSPKQPITAERVELASPMDLVNRAYDTLLLDQQLEQYALNPGRDEGFVLASLLSYGQTVAGLALDADGAIDLGVVRGAVDRLYDGMESVARRKYGPLPPRSRTEAVLLSLGLVKPEHETHFHRLDDRYWNRQFMEEYGDQLRVRREEGESEQSYLGRHIALCLAAFPWANYTNYIIYDE